MAFGWDGVYSNGKIQLLNHSFDEKDLEMGRDLGEQGIELLLNIDILLNSFFE